jgi:hypothetical protein
MEVFQDLSVRDSSARLVLHDPAPPAEEPPPERGSPVEEALSACRGEVAYFFDALAAQGVEAMEQLKSCRNPIDVLSVQQAWIGARSKIYFDSGLRLARIFTVAAQELMGSPGQPADS